jgi:hypothetical protein
VKSETKSALLAGSILLNLAVLAIFIWFVGYTRKLMVDLEVKTTTEKISVQEFVMTEIASQDSARISEMTNTLFWNVDALKRVLYKIDTKTPLPKLPPDIK